MKFFKMLKQLNRMSFIYKNLDMSQRYTAFTLAEVLITLAIIGVVAAMTIPSLISTINDLQYKTAYKKAVAVASQAFLAIDQSSLVNLAEETSDASPTYFKLFMAQFKTVKECTSNNNSDCWESTGELFGKDFSSGFPMAYHNAFIDNSGMVWTVLNGASTGRIGVDTNGMKSPNVYGKDRFVLMFRDADNTTNGFPFKIVPWADCSAETYITTPNNCANVCPGNQCGTVGSPMYHKYYGRSWLYN